MGRSSTLTSALTLIGLVIYFKFELLKGARKLKNFRIFGVILLVMLMALPALAETPFKDVPEDHWAKWAVIDLVKLGVTQGYPDGTFRGNKNITRYETAIFLAKLADAIGEGKVEEVDLSSIKADIQALKEEIAALREAPEDKMGGIPINGSFMSRYRIGNLFAGTRASGTAAPKGPRVDYRIKTMLHKEFSDDASVRINLDTMDAGFNGGSENLATRLLDAEGRMRVNFGIGNPVDVKVTAGPGPVTYFATQDAVLPSEVGTVYWRPRNSMILSTYFGGMDVSAGYIARSITSSGEVQVDQLTTTLGYNFSQVPVLGMLRLAATWDYVAQGMLGSSGTPNDGRAKIFMGAVLNPKVQGDITYGFSNRSGSEGSYLGFGLSLIDPWDTGTVISFKLHSVSPNYLSPGLLTAEADMIGLDYFDKYLTNNTIDIGGEFTQVLTEVFTLKGKFDYRYSRDKNYGESDAASRTTIETGISYALAPTMHLDFLYKIYQVPSNAADKTSDVFSLEFLYKF